MGGRRTAAARRLLLCIAALLACAGCATPERPDPLEKMNRGVFAFNEGLDRYALEPAAKAWDFVLPGFVQDGIQNFFRNLDMPIILANELLQAKPAGAVEDLARFFFNSTLGLAGFVDVATRMLGELEVLRQPDPALDPPGRRPGWWSAITRGLRPGEAGEARDPGDPDLVI